MFESTENHFRKWFSVKLTRLAATENRFSGKSFPFDQNLHLLTRKSFYIFVLPSNDFRSTRKREKHTQPKRNKTQEANKLDYLLKFFNITIIIFKKLSQSWLVLVWILKFMFINVLSEIIFSLKIWASWVCTKIVTPQLPTRKILSKAYGWGCATTHSICLNRPTRFAPHRHIIFLSKQVGRVQLIK